MSSSDIKQITIEQEMRSSYLDYAMSVIVSRALPDVRDGLKPVHRRILYAMRESGNFFNRPYRKCASPVGYVLVKYHPHGDAPVYEALVRMAQDFSMRMPLIDGQGNFGSIDGDPPAAFRYTEARLAKIAHTLLEDIDKDTVNFQPNFDNSTKEPCVLPARFPNVLVNGAGGIAVGMATNIPPHNLGEVLDACCAFIDNPDITTKELIEFIPGPDFPTGALIIGKSGILKAYETGRGSILMRAKTHIEEVSREKNAIIVTEIPYQVNKSKMIERIAEAVNNKVIEGITDLRDESDRDGIRVVIELKKNVDSEIILNQLYRHTSLQTSFGVNLLALDKSVRPQLMGLKKVIESFIEFRREVITRKVNYSLIKARDKAHIFLGLAVAIANIDEMIALIRSAPSPAIAREQMMRKAWNANEILHLILMVEDKDVADKKYNLTESQANAILDLKLHRLTGLERKKIEEDLNDLVGKIKEYLEILSSPEKLFTIMRKEFLEIKEQFSNARRTEIIEEDLITDIEDLIQKEEMVITVSHSGYIKRVPLSTYKAQNRGGKGRAGMSIREEDFVKEIFVSDTLVPVLFFSSLGKVYQLKVYKLPEGTPQSKGKAIINILPLQKGEIISTIMPLPKTKESLDIIFVTSKGKIRRNSLLDFVDIRVNGKIAMKLNEGENLVAVKVCDKDSDILLTMRKGKCIRFPVDAVRRFKGRTSTGVRGIKLLNNDEVISMSILKHVEISVEERNSYNQIPSKLKYLEDSKKQKNLNAKLKDLSARFKDLINDEQFILSVSSKGYGKITSAYEYRITNRGGSGIANMELTSRNGFVTASFPVDIDDQIVLVTNEGQLIRLSMKNIRIAGRRTQGVRLFRISQDEEVVSVSRIPKDDTCSDDNE